MNTKGLSFEYKYLVVIQGNNHQFSLEEFKTLYSVYFSECEIELSQIQNTLYLLQTQKKLPSIDHPLFTRITFVDSIYEYINQGDDFPQLLERLELKIHTYSKSFGVNQVSFKTKSRIENKTLAYPIHKQLKHLLVDLKDPNHLFMYIFVPKQVYFAELIFRNKKEYLKRMPKLRPVAKPYTLKSDMARAGINLLGLKEDELVLDPFCGIGGILLEAGDMKLQTIGNDINYNDLEHLKTNFEHFRYSFPELICKDATEQFLDNESVDGIISDIPYGKSSRKLGTELYNKFLQSAHNMLKPGSKMVIIYADFTDFKPLALKYFEEVFEIEEYINKSMTRFVLVLRKK